MPVTLFENAQVFIVAGTSAQVYPAAGLIPLAINNGATVIEINPEATDFSRDVTFALRGTSAYILPQLDLNSCIEDRFAPAPTGPLHVGSLVAAVASDLDARAAGGEWLVRMEDLDTPRNVPGGAADILRTLERFGFEWDGPVMYQSECIDAYEGALDQLRQKDAVYPCHCSRWEICDCRNGIRDSAKPPAWRIRGPRTVEVDDFVVFRADGIFAYQMAVVVDDAAQGITDVVRGADLLDSTPRQQHLQSVLGYSHPRYKHIPVVTNEAGEKLSKQTNAPPLHDPVTQLREALRFLEQRP